MRKVPRLLGLIITLGLLMSCTKKGLSMQELSDYLMTIQEPTQIARIEEKFSLKANSITGTKEYEYSYTIQGCNVSLFADANRNMTHYRLPLDAKCPLTMTIDSLIHVNSKTFTIQSLFDSKDSDCYAANVKSMYCDSNCGTAFRNIPRHLELNLDVKLTGGQEQCVKVVDYNPFPNYRTLLKFNFDMTNAMEDWTAQAMNQTTEEEDSKSGTLQIVEVMIDDDSSIEAETRKTAIKYWGQERPKSIERFLYKKIK
jgi:hypothetical protein